MSRLGGQRNSLQLGESVTKLSRYPKAVDILITSLGKVLQDTDKYRRIPLHNKNFQENVVQADGGIELLNFVGYVDQGTYMVLRNVNLNRIREAKSALEQVRNHSLTYRDAKEADQIQLAILTSKEDFEEQQVRRKAALLKMVPQEPAEGTAGSVRICFHLKDGGTERKVWRRFESHDTLEDVYNYVGSLKELETERWQLVNVTMSPPILLNPEKQRFTLQKLDLWPVGHLLIQVS